MAENDSKEMLYRIAFRLALFTIFYNFAEGLVSMAFGYKDESLTLLGFGVDSFIEVISGLGIAHMVARIRRNRLDHHYSFEKTALKVTGYSFYALVLGLLATGANNLITGQKPETTVTGVIISLISIAVMVELKRRKSKIGFALKSDAILADAECTQVCIYMSIVLLTASALYALTKVSYVDIVGSLALAYLSYKEGRECFEKAKSDEPYSCDND